MAASGSEIRATLDHPVIDADGHTIEYLPHVHDLIRDIGGTQALDGWLTVEHGTALVHTLDLRTRRELGVEPDVMVGLPAEQTLDRATAMLPGLMYERLDELGIDFAVLYPTYGLVVMGLDDPATRVAAARAFNTYYAEVFSPYRDRLEPVAIVPTFTPDEAIDVLDHAIGTLGLKAVMCTGLVQRPVPGAEHLRSARWVDALGLDSAHDYDPFWSSCAELGVSPTFHSTGMGWGGRVSPTNYMANHLGSFAAAGEALCRSLFMGGVMHRFPNLRFAFLEGGVAWAAELCANLVGHWEKRHSDVIGRYDPARLDRAALLGLAERYGGAGLRARIDRLDDALRMLSDPDDRPVALDEFAAAGISSPDDVRRVFATQCFFGCEADDPLVTIALDPQFAGTRLPAMFASDIGHWDVPDVREVLPEAYELVDEGRLSPADFRAFTFEHAAQLWAGTNDEFFRGTRVDTDVRAVLADSVTIVEAAEPIVTAAQVEAFRRDGFVVVDGLLDADELAHYEPIVTAAVKARKDPDTRALHEKTLYEQSFLQCQNLWEDFPAVRPLTFHARVGQAAAELLGTHAVRLWHDQALYKEAHGRETDPHQDQPYWPIAETDTITAWIPLRGSTLASGAMGYLPGSHAVGVRKFANIFAASDPRELLELPELRDIEPVFVEVPPGGVAFHAGLTVHMAKPNTTDEPRAVHTVIMFADGCTRRNQLPHMSVDRDGIEVGALIAGECTPIIWPRAYASLPDPPAPLPEAILGLAPVGTLPASGATTLDQTDGRDDTL